MRPDEGGLRERVLEYLRSHHTMTIATWGPDAPPGVDAGLQRPAKAVETRIEGVERNAPHAASVFYAVDDDLRLVFLSKRTSLHGLHIGEVGPVAVTISEHYADWEQIQGVQLWGEARLLEGSAKAGAFVHYLKRFPFVRDLAADPHRAELMRGVAVYRVDPARAAFTDNRTGLFGREVLQLRGVERWR